MATRKYVPIALTLLVIGIFLMSQGSLTAPRLDDLEFEVVEPHDPMVETVRDLLEEMEALLEETEVAFGASSPEYEQALFSYERTEAYLADVLSSRETLIYVNVSLVNTNSRELKIDSLVAEVSLDDTKIETINIDGLKIQGASNRKISLKIQGDPEINQILDSGIFTELKLELKGEARRLLQTQEFTSLISTTI